MIKLVFVMPSREVFRLVINERNIFYGDKNWNELIRLVPKDADFIRKIIFSRGKIPNAMKEMFNLTKAEQEQYDSAKDDRALAAICIDDCKRKGAKLESHEESTTQTQAEETSPEELNVEKSND